VKLMTGAKRTNKIPLLPPKYMIGTNKINAPIAAKKGNNQLNRSRVAAPLSIGTSPEITFLQSLLTPELP
jgi:hypothetical protein